MSEERIRLRRNPRNVAVPSGYGDLYFNSSGQLIKELHGGVKETIGEVTEASVLAAIGNSLVLDSLFLSDQSDTILVADPGSGTAEVALDSNGRPIYATPDGNREIGSSSRFRIDTAITIAAASIVAGSAYYPIGYFQLNEDEFALNQAFRISGVIGAQASGDTYAEAAACGFRPEGATAAGFKEAQNIMGANGAAGQTNWFPRAKLVAASTGTKLVIREYVTPGTGAVMSNMTRYHATDPALIMVGANNTNTGSLPTNGGETIANGGTGRIEVYINCPQDAGFTGQIDVYARLKLELIA